jgi:uncharacterized Ntn-hydrolase superfamily protein
LLRRRYYAAIPRSTSFVVFCGVICIRAGRTPAEALASLVDEDADSAIRQVGMVDARGLAATHTGEGCIRMAGHRRGEGYSVQANMMTSDTVWGAMAETFESASGDLAHFITAYRQYQIGIQHRF